jgi:hypothetical protein
MAKKGHPITQARQQAGEERYYLARMGFDLEGFRLALTDCRVELLQRQRNRELRCDSGEATGFCCMGIGRLFLVMVGAGEF